MAIAELSKLKFGLIEETFLPAGRNGLPFSSHLGRAVIMAHGTTVGSGCLHVFLLQIVVVAQVQFSKAEFVEGDYSHSKQAPMTRGIFPASKYKLTVLVTNFLMPSGTLCCIFRACFRYANDKTLQEAIEIIADRGVLDIWVQGTSFETIGTYLKVGSVPLETYNINESK